MEFKKIIKTGRLFIKENKRLIKRIALAILLTPILLILLLFFVSLFLCSNDTISNHKKLNRLEKEEGIKASEAADLQEVAGVLETIGAGLSAVPQIISGFGVSVEFGGLHLGAVISAVGRGFQTASSKKSFQSSNASRKSGHLRQLQERIQQANLAGRELKQIDKQIVAQKIRIQLAEQEIINHQKQIDNSKEIEDFLKSKYTNEQLYQYMEGHVKTLFYQAYTML